MKQWPLLVSVVCLAVMSSLVSQLHFSLWEEQEKTRKYTVHHTGGSIHNSYEDASSLNLDGM